MKEKKIVIKNCHECPHYDKLFSKTNKYYCNELSQLVLINAGFKTIPSLEKEVNVSSNGIHEDCPLKNNY